MQLTINGETREVEDIRTLAQLIASLELPGVEGIAVAVNDTVVPRSRWDATALASGDRIEVIHAVQGG
jgi:sulfur carrier protein